MRLLENIIITGITLLIFIISQCIEIDNSALSALVNSVPILILSIYMWINVPKNYLKIMSLKNIDIKFKLFLSIRDCGISENDYNTIKNNIIHIDQTNNGKIIAETMGEHMYKSSMAVDTALIELAYDLEQEILILKAEHIRKYKSFFNFSNKLFIAIQSTFISSNDISYNEDQVRIKLVIDFIDKNDSDVKNPFWMKIFNGFKNKVISFKYLTQNGTSVMISNDSIEFTGRDISTIDKDVSKELSFFKIRN